MEHPNGHYHHHNNNSNNSNRTHQKGGQVDDDDTCITTTPSSSSSVYIYHERQEGHLCGQHALNNFVQAPVYTVELLAQIAQQLDEYEDKIYHDHTNTNTNTNGSQYNNNNNNNRNRYGLISSNSSHHVDETGNFSIEVLKAALMELYHLPLVHLGSEHGKTYLQTRDITTIAGFVCHKSDHWFALRLIQSRYWNLNSTLLHPVVVPHFTLATEMEVWSTQGYTIFCVLDHQLPECQGPIQPQQLLSSSSANSFSGVGNGTWYKISDLLQGKATPIKEEEDPWGKLQGTGVRLDGQRPSSLLKPPVQNNTRSAVEGFTEEEMIQLAIEASIMEATTTSATTTVLSSNHWMEPDHAYLQQQLPLEPEADAPNVTRIQFRIPNPQQLQKIVRRFYTTDSLATVYAFVAMQLSTSTTPSSGPNFELLVGFPPRHLNTLPRYHTTIADAKLNNESIQVRFM
jgi:Ataxin-3